MKKVSASSKTKKVKSKKEVKVAKTFRIDPDLLLWLEAEGKKEGMGYQTYLNWFLRKAKNQTMSIEDRIRQLENAISNKK